MIKYIILNLLIYASVVNSNNCKNFLTMEGNGQQMSIMLCMKTNSIESTISKTNLSNLTIDKTNETVNLTTSTNITTLHNGLFNVTNNINLFVGFNGSAKYPNTCISLSFNSIIPSFSLSKWSWFALPNKDDIM